MKEYTCKICGALSVENSNGYYATGPDRICKCCKDRMYDTVDYDFSVSPRNPYSPIGLAVAKVIDKELPWFDGMEDDELYDFTDHVLNFSWIEDTATPDLNKLYRQFRHNRRIMRGI